MKGTATIKLVYKPLTRSALRSALIGRNRSRRKPERGRFTAADVNHLLEQAWQSFDDLVPAVPAQPTVGSWMNVLLAAVMLSMFNALLAAGVERDYAIDLCADIAWKVYAKWAAIANLLSWFCGRDAFQRLRMRVDLFLRFPFNPPGYGVERLPSNDVVAFEIVRCPISDYLRAHNAADLCVGAWCNLDYALAETWDGKLDRTSTLAAGDGQCSFRFSVKKPV